jgi:hypothetical protein
MIQLANGGGLHPARNVVGGDFLHLVRLGIRSANDPIVRDSIEVIDRVLKHDLPQGPGWRRYNHDGYGQKDDGSAFDGTGVGRCWPILTGERGHYELAAGRDPLPFINSLRISRGKILRIILAAEATIVWSTDDWARTNRSNTTHESGLNLWFADFPTAEWPAGSVFTFTSFWKRDQRWEGRNWQVSVQ